MRALNPLLAAGVLLLATLVVPARTSAQLAPLQPTQIVNLGHVEVWSVPDFQPPPPPGPVPAKGVAPDFVVMSRPVSLAEARASAGFPLVFPNRRPEGAALVQVQTLDRPGAGVEVILVYRDPTVDPRVAGPHEIVIHQQRWAGISRIVMPRALEEGAVAGRPAVFWSFTIPAAATAAGFVGRDFVMFEQGELLITIDAAGLTRDELVTVAESLVPER